MTSALVPLTAQDLTIWKELEIALSSFVEPADKADIWLDLIHIEAARQIASETDPDSPWLDEKKTPEVRAGRLEFHTWTRALEIVANLQKVMEINLYAITGIIWRKRLDLFPMDGTWEDLVEILVKHTGMNRSRAGQVSRFIQEVGEQFVEAGVSPHNIAEIIQEHSRAGQIGLSILAPMSTAGSKVLADPDLTKAEKKKKMKEIAKDARENTVNDFENQVYGKAIPQLLYQEQAEDGGATMFIFKAATPRQASLLRGRMRDAMVEDSGLFRPVTPSQILTASHLNDWGGLVKAAVLADRACRILYGMLEASSGPCDYDYFEQYSDLPQSAIEHGLGELVRFELADQLNMGGKKLWDAR